MTKQSACHNSRCPTIAGSSFLRAMLSSASLSKSLAFHNPQTGHAKPTSCHQLSVIPTSTHTHTHTHTQEYSRIHHPPSKGTSHQPSLLKQLAHPQGKTWAPAATTKIFPWCNATPPNFSRPSFQRNLAGIVHSQPQVSPSKTDLSSEQRELRKSESEKARAVLKPGTRDQNSGVPALARALFF